MRSANSISFHCFQIHVVACAASALPVVAAFFLSVVVLSTPLRAQDDPAQQDAADAADPAGDTASDRVVPGGPLPPTQASVTAGKFREEFQIDGENRFRYGRELHADGFRDRSAQILRDFLVLFPRHPRRFEALRILAEIEVEKDRPVPAIDYYRRAFREVPGQDRGLEAYLQAGRLLAGLGETETAREVFEDIRRRKPDSRVARQAGNELQALGLRRFDNAATDPAGDGTSGGDATSTGDDDRTARPDSGDAGPDASGVADTDGASTGEAGMLDGAGTAEQTKPEPSGNRQNQGDTTGSPGEEGPGNRQGSESLLDRVGEGVEISE